MLRRGNLSLFLFHPNLQASKKDFHQYFFYYALHTMNAAPTHMILRNKPSPVPLRHSKSINVYADADASTLNGQAKSQFLHRPPPQILPCQVPSEKPLQKPVTKKQAAAEVTMISSEPTSISITSNAAETSVDASSEVKNPRRRGCRGGRKQRIRKQREATRPKTKPTATSTSMHTSNKKKKTVFRLPDAEAKRLFAAVVVKDNVDSISPDAPRCCIHILDEDAPSEGTWDGFMCRVSFADNTKDVEVNSTDLLGFISFVLECDKKWVFHIKLQSSGVSFEVSSNDILQHLKFAVQYGVRDLRDTLKTRKPWQREWFFLDNHLMYY